MLEKFPALVDSINTIRNGQRVPSQETEYGSSKKQATNPTSERLVAESGHPHKLYAPANDSIPVLTVYHEHQTVKNGEEFEIGHYSFTEFHFYCFIHFQFFLPKIDRGFLQRSITGKIISYPI